MAHGFKVGDRVRRKGDVGYGTIEFINGPGTHCDIRYILGVTQSLYITEIELEEPGVWEVWRQDDHGNKVRIQWKLSEFDAKNLKNMLEARGHKQMYWYERSNESHPRY